jgi:hypothetical protein
METTMANDQGFRMTGRAKTGRGTVLVQMLALAVVVMAALGAGAPRLEAQAAETTIVCFTYPNGAHYETENIYLWRYFPNSQQYRLVDESNTNPYGCIEVIGEPGNSFKVTAGYSFTPASDGVTRCYFGQTPVFKTGNVSRLDRALSGPGYGTSSTECQNLFRWDG